MQNLRNKLYNYETPPPDDIWDKISFELDEQKVVQLKGWRGRSKLIYYGATAAAALFIIFLSSIFLNKNSNDFSPQGNSKTTSYFSSATVDSINRNYQLLEKIINTPKEKKLLASNNVIADGFSKKYITIAGPQGQPVRISEKVATLILSADKEYPPKPVWNETIDKWQQIMLSNTFSPTSSGIMDLLQKASNNVE